jgi:hypothetical protein
MRGLTTLLSTAALLAGIALAPSANAQISINIGVQPVCSYGYYGYAPYACAPMGYYGSGYFYNGIFVGMGPWAGWGYEHGWGGHRFAEDGGGRYHGGIGRVAYGGHAGGGRSERIEGGEHMSSGGARPSAGHVASHNAVTHNAAPRNSAPRTAAPRGDSHGGGGKTHSGGEQAHGGGHPGGDHK